MGKRKTLTSQTQKDQEMTVIRLKQNEAKIGKVTEILESLLGQRVQKKVLLEVAKEVSKKTRITLDRLAKRSRDCLICWFCENFEQVLPYTREILTSQSTIPTFMNQEISSNNNIIDNGLITGQVDPCPITGNGIVPLSTSFTDDYFIFNADDFYADDAAWNFVDAWN